MNPVPRTEERPYSMIELQPLACADREQFIKDNQEAFNYGALVEFGRRDDILRRRGRSPPARQSKPPSMAVRPIASCRTAGPLAAW